MTTAADAAGSCEQDDGWPSRLLGYRVPRRTPLRRAAAVAASSRLASRLLARASPPVDRFLARRSGGRLSTPGLFVGLPTVQLITTGARTGLERSTTLVPVLLPGGGLAVVGSNFGGERKPAWVANLLAQPQAVLAHAGRSVPVHARPLEGAERDEALAVAGRLYRGFAVYPGRAAHRQVRVFSLEPLCPDEGSPS